jgi:hypothetical protein
MTAHIQFLSKFVTRVNVERIINISSGSGNEYLTRQFKFQVLWRFKQGSMSTSVVQISRNERNFNFIANNVIYATEAKYPADRYLAYQGMRRSLFILLILPLFIQDLIFSYL